MSENLGTLHYALSELPGPECFSFCLNSILSDVALRDPSSTDKV